MKERVKVRARASWRVRKRNNQGTKETRKKGGLEAGARSKVEAKDCDLIPSGVGPYDSDGGYVHLKLEFEEMGP